MTFEEFIKQNKAAALLYKKWEFISNLRGMEYVGYSVLVGLAQSYETARLRETIERMIKSDGGGQAEEVSPAGHKPRSG